MAEDLDEASNELIITDEDSVRYSVGETFVTVENDEVGAPGDGGRQGWKKPNEKPKKKNQKFSPPNQPSSNKVLGYKESTPIINTTHHLFFLFSLISRRRTLLAG